MLTKAVQFIDNQNGWAVGYAGRIVHTTDGGNSSGVYIYQLKAGGTVKTKGMIFLK
jgi:photosystem II stability/assembly factor-like uncharacterized protein